MQGRDHVAILLYALEQKYDPRPPHVSRLALSDIAAAGFNPSARVQLPQAMAGLQWRGRRLIAGEEAPAGEASYLEHVVVGQEWPLGTTLAAYLRSLRDLFLDPLAGAFIARQSGDDRIGVARESRALRGPDGADFVIAAYDPASRYWLAGWQPTEGLAAIAGGEWSDVSWLRIPR